METFELRYFLAVAETENIHRASEALNVSPGSLSKAVARLEDELGVSLFSREGRNIKLSHHGRLLQRRAADIIFLEESTKVEILGSRAAVHVSIAGPETLLDNYGTQLSATIKKKLPNAVFDWHVCDDEQAVYKVEQGESLLAIVSQSVPKNWSTKALGKVAFETCVGPGHPLFNDATAKREVSVKTILEHGFVRPRHSILGRVGANQSVDGWRDDEFPRKIAHYASSLQLVSNLVMSGQALAYLPDYFVEKMGAKTIRVSGCPYSCQQTIKLVTRDAKRTGWLNQLF